jgi:hypothetical protein
MPNQFNVCPVHLVEHIDGAKWSVRKLLTNYEHCHCGFLASHAVTPLTQVKPAQVKLKLNEIIKQEYL